MVYAIFRTFARRAIEPPPPAVGKGLLSRRLRRSAKGYWAAASGGRQRVKVRTVVQHTISVPPRSARSLSYTSSRLLRGCPSSAERNRAEFGFVIIVTHTIRKFETRTLRKDGCTAHYVASSGSSSIAFLYFSSASLGSCIFTKREPCGDLFRTCNNSRDRQIEGNANEEKYSCTAHYFALSGPRPIAFWSFCSVFPRLSIFSKKRQCGHWFVIVVTHTIRKLGDRITERDSCTHYSHFSGSSSIAFWNFSPAFPSSPIFCKSKACGDWIRNRCNSYNQKIVTRSLELSPFVCIGTSPVVCKWLVPPPAVYKGLK